MKSHLRPIFAVCKILYLFLTPNNILINNTDSFGVRLIKAPILALSLSVNLATCTILHLISILIVLGQAISATIAVGVCVLGESLIAVIKAVYCVCMGHTKKHTGRDGSSYTHTHRAWCELGEALQALTWSIGQMITMPFIYSTKLLWYVIFGTWSGLYPLAETVSQLGLALAVDYCDGLLTNHCDTPVKNLSQHTQEKKLLDMLASDMRKKLPSNNDSHSVSRISTKQDNARLIKQTAAVCIDGTMKFANESIFKNSRVSWYPENVRHSLREYCIEYKAAKTSSYFFNLCEGIKKAEQDSDEYKLLKEQLELVIRGKSMWFLENYVFDQAEMVRGTEAKTMKTMS